MVTLYPLACKSFARDAEIIPFPNEDVTPPVTKMYLAAATVFKFVKAIQRCSPGLRVMKNQNEIEKKIFRTRGANLDNRKRITTDEASFFSAWFKSQVPLL